MKIEYEVVRVCYDGRKAVSSDTVAVITRDHTTQLSELYTTCAEWLEAVKAGRADVRALIIPRCTADDADSIYRVCDYARRSLMRYLLKNGAMGKNEKPADSIAYETAMEVNGSLKEDMTQEGALAVLEAFSSGDALTAYDTYVAARRRMDAYRQRLHRARPAAYYDPSYGGHLDSALNVRPPRASDPYACTLIRDAERTAYADTMTVPQQRAYAWKRLPATSRPTVDQTLKLEKCGRSAWYKRIDAALYKVILEMIPNWSDISSPFQLTRDDWKEIVILYYKKSTGLELSDKYKEKIDVAIDSGAMITARRRAACAAVVKACMGKRLKPDALKVAKKRAKSAHKMIIGRVQSIYELKK